MAILDEVTAACETLLAQTFEGYHSLSEKEACGLLSGGASGPESPASAIAPAVSLFGAPSTAYEYAGCAIELGSMPMDMHNKQEH